ncbi:TRAF-type zinc finger domain-containing protein 1 [Trichoplax sp. H2]|nr:TRAF-type zinc finger domain-containing protein 1 [Trichoplax sp. H2]|eukprot:RDD47464.1 TRAF-type zinc finger domain-containing protein 1 [Trichoplax sp. H2]
MQPNLSNHSDKMEVKEETEHCVNCARDIPARNFQMHHLHCVRNIINCKLCHEPIAKTQEESHFEEYHIKVKCSKCDQIMEKYEMEDHQKQLCPERLRICDYCEIEVKANQFDNHVIFCGARTDKCPYCEKLIMLKDTASHRMTCGKREIANSMNLSAEASRDKSQDQTISNGHCVDREGKAENLRSCKPFLANKDANPSFRTNLLGNEETYQSIDGVHSSSAAHINDIQKLRSKDSRKERKLKLSNKQNDTSSSHANIQFGNTPLDSLLRRYATKSEANNYIDDIISSSEALYQNIPALNSQSLQASDDGTRNANNSGRKGKLNDKASLNDRFDEQGVVRVNRNLGQYLSTPGSPKLRYGKNGIGTNGAVSSHEDLRFSNQSDSKQKSTATAVTRTDASNQYGNDRTKIDVRKTTNYERPKSLLNQEGTLYQLDRNKSSNKRHFQNKNFNKRQVHDRDKGDVGVKEKDQDKLDHEYAMALHMQLNDDNFEDAIDPSSGDTTRRVPIPADQLGSKTKPLYPIKLADPTVSSTLGTSQPQISSLNAQEQLDWKFAMQLHEQLNTEVPESGLDNIPSSKDKQVCKKRDHSSKESSMQAADIPTNNTTKFNMSLTSSRNTTELETDVREGIKWDQQENEKFIDNIFRTTFGQSNNSKLLEDESAQLADISSYNEQRLSRTSISNTCNDLENNDNVSSNITSHHSQCREFCTSPRDQEDDVFIPCEFCRKLYPGTHFKEHEELCYRKHHSMNEGIGLTNSVSETTSNDMPNTGVELSHLLSLDHISPTFQRRNYTNENDNYREYKEPKDRITTNSDLKISSTIIKDINKRIFTRKQKSTGLPNDKKSGSVMPSHAVHYTSDEDKISHLPFQKKDKLRTISQPSAKLSGPDIASAFDNSSHLYQDREISVEVPTTTRSEKLKKSNRSNPLPSHNNSIISRNTSVTSISKHDSNITSSGYRSSGVVRPRKSTVNGLHNPLYDKKSEKSRSLFNGSAQQSSHNTTETKSAGDPKDGYDGHYDRNDEELALNSQWRTSQILSRDYVSRGRLPFEGSVRSAKNKKHSKKTRSGHE